MQARLQKNRQRKTQPLIKLQAIKDSADWMRTRHQRTTQQGISPLIKQDIKEHSRLDADKASKDYAAEDINSHQTRHQRTGQTRCR
eukprot:1162036-Pelagomonas_calceolata.AAC.5